ncbi:MAG: acyl-CoA dehydrogenase family protein [Desulfovibrio sp.]|jgi:alkylation response protein AidB-like acyl-CoA dehydrogenase|nr:acyl-CoA dehydrogenase family protein [Desulfovibrio sp.]
MFALTDEQQLIQKTAAEFVAKELLPSINERYVYDAPYDRKPFEEAAKLGLVGIPYPQEYGGAGADVVSYAIAMEEIGKVDGGFAISVSVHTSLCSWPIYHYGTEEQKKKFLTPLASGKAMGSFGLTEPDAGTDVGGGKTVAEDKGDHYLLNGSKCFITNAGESDIYTVFGVTDKSVPAFKGMSAFILEKGMPGFTFGKTERTLGINSARVRELIFNNVQVPKENLLGKVGDGFKIAMASLDGGRIGVAAQAVGIAAGALNHAITYTKTRQQFGKPISSNQALQFMMAEMATKIDAARLLTHRAAYAKDTQKSWSKEAAMAKMFASDTAMSVTTDAVQLFGGYGYTRDMPIERYFRDAKITQIYEGTNQVQRMVIAGSILR